MGKATERHGIPHMLEKTAPTPTMLWRMNARLIAVKNLLIDKGIITEEEYSTEFNKCFETVTEKRRKKIRERAAPGEAK